MGTFLQKFRQVMRFEPAVMWRWEGWLQGGPIGKKPGALGRHETPSMTPDSAQRDASLSEAF